MSAPGHAHTRRGIAHALSTPESRLCHDLAPHPGCDCQACVSYFAHQTWPDPLRERFGGQ